MMSYRDIEDIGNSPKYHTGKKCISLGCNNPAGTAWSPYWCVEHNIERMDRVSDGFASVTQLMQKKKDLGYYG